MKSLFERKWLSKLLPVSLFSIITIGIFMPSSLFLGNIDEFSIDYVRALPIILFCSLLLFVVELIVGVLLSKFKTIFEIYLNLIFGLTLGFYLQGNFLNGKLPQLNGKEIVWENSSVSAILSAVVWIACLLLVQVFYFVNSRIFEKVRFYGGYFISAMQFLTLLVLVFSTTRVVSNEVVVTKNGQFELGSRNNVVVFVIDTLDAKWAEQYINANERWRDTLKDFVYFDNVVAGGAPTVLGMPLLFTGQTYDYPYEMTKDQYYRQAYEKSTFFSDLKRNGYTINLYTSASVLNHADIKDIDNVIAGEYIVAKKSGFAKCLYELTFYYAMPYQLKKHFVFYSGDFSDYISVKAAEEYKFDDPQFYQEFRQNGLSKGKQQKTFVLYHMFGAHSPYSMNENCEKVSEEETTLEKQIHGSMKIISEYFDEMKRLGIYDSSTIIITADHGGEDLYQNPAVYIKQPGNQSEGLLEVNSSPATFKNLHATFAAACLENAESYGKNMFEDLSENVQNGRYHTADGLLREEAFAVEKTGCMYDRYKIGDWARDTSQIVDAIEYFRDFEPYQLGTEISFTAANWEMGAGKYNKKSICEPGKEYTWTQGKNLEMHLEIEDVSSDLVLTMQYATFLDRQTVKIYVNDNLVSEYVASGEEIKEYVIPKDYLNNKKVVFRMEFPDACSPYSVGMNDDIRELALGMKMIKFSKEQ